MAAGGWLVLLLVALNLSISAHPCDAQELRCQCIQVLSEPILLRFITAIQVIPKNIYCSRNEVIAMLKNGKSTCLDTKAEWVMALIKMILDRLLPEDHKETEDPVGMKSEGSLYLLKFEYSLERNTFV